MGTTQMMAGMPMPQEMMERAKQMGQQEDAIKQDLMTSTTPQGEYSSGAMNQMLTELNKILAMFNQPEIPQMTEEVVMFPEEVVNMLMMISDAAMDAGVDFELDLQSIASDADLKFLAGALRSLAGNTKFKKFLESNSMMQEEPMMEEPPPRTTNTEDIDAMFAQRS